jgi:beta-lactam-binding protein with PASTA domain
VANKANAPVIVALDGEDPEGELRFGFNRPPQEIPPGGVITTQMQVRPPKPLWIGRSLDRQLSVATVTGEEAAARAAAEPLGAAILEHAPEPKKKRFWQRRAPHVPGVYPPRVFKPQLYPPDVQMGPGGFNVRMPKLRAPQVQGPKLGSVNAGQMQGKLKMPGRGGPAAPSAPMLPTQGIFRQRPWITWWLPLLLVLLVVLLLLLYKLFAPSNTVVPNVVGQKSAFAAEEVLTKSHLKLDPSPKTVVDDRSPAGTVLKQTPAKGAEVKKDSAVTILIAIGSGKVSVPDITGKTAADADKLLREKNLTLGQSSPPNADPKLAIASQIPAKGEIVKAGTPVNIFYPDPTAPEKQKGKGKAGANGKKAGAGAAGAGAGGGAGGAGGAGAKDIAVPAVEGKDTVVTYAKKAADLGIVPVSVKQFNDAPADTVVGTSPGPGSKVAKGAKLQVFVSAGQPQVIFTNGKDIKRINGANGAPLDPVAKTSADEEDPTWTGDGQHVAFTSDGRVMLKDITKKNADAVPVTKDGSKFENLAWAPTVDIQVLAMNDVKDGSDDSDLCLARVRADSTDVSCLTEPKFAVTRAIHWAPDGRSILALGVKLPSGDGVSGIVRWKLKKGAKPFSPDVGDWSKGKFVTDTKTPGKGVLDAAISPDGKRLALATNLGTSAYRLVLTDAGDFKMKKAFKTTQRACKVAWRSDGQALLLIQGDAECSEDVSALVRVDAKTPRNARDLNASGDDGAFQPLKLGG